MDEKEIREHVYVAQSLMAKLVDLGTPQHLVGGNRIRIPSGCGIIEANRLVNE